MVVSDILAGIRDGLAAEISCKGSTVEPLPAPVVADRWVLLSAFQKAIRRGDLSVAGQTGFALLCLDRQALFRRIPVIVLEDVGVGDINCTTEAIAASTSATWRKSVGGDEIVLHHLIRRMCSCTKDRAADNAILAAKDHPMFAEERQRIGSMDDAHLADAVRDTDLPTTTRVMAAWLLAGTDRYTSNRWGFRRGNLDGLFAVLQGTDVPASLWAACRAAAGLMRYPLPISVPVMWAAYCKQSTMVEHCAVSSCPVVDGIPTYALGKHTRAGKYGLRLLVEQSSKLRRVLAQFPLCKDWPGAVGAAHFHVESAEIARKLIWEEGSRLEHLGAVGDANTFGVPIDAAPDLLGQVRSEHDLFNSIRVRLLPRTTV